MTPRLLILVLAVLLACGAIIGVVGARKALQWRGMARSARAQLAGYPGPSAYAAENGKIASSGTRPDVVFIGASHTLEWGDLAARFPSLEIVNRGTGGLLVPQYLLRFRQDVLDLNPKVVVIEGCAINVTEKVPLRSLLDSYASMAEIARLHGIEPVIATIMPVRPPYETEWPGTNRAVAEINDGIRRLAKEQGIAVADYAAAVTGSDGRLDDPGSHDGLHCSPSTYDRAFTRLKPAVDEALHAAAARPVAAPR